MSALLQQSVATVRERSGAAPFDLAVVLGSGLGGVVDSASVETAIPYADLPVLPVGQVEGHQGRLIVATLHGKRVLLFQGRFHLYQGFSARQVATPVMLAHALGCRDLVLTNASGGIRPDFKPGEFMLITDHINLMGDNPLRGETAHPFVNLCALYRQDCFDPLSRSAAAAGWPLRKGVLGGMTGPSYETPAEIRALQVLGADAVSMSTIPEAIMARYLGLSTVGLSLIANRAAGLSDATLNHTDVLTIGNAAVPRLALLLAALLQEPA